MSSSVGNVGLISASDFQHLKKSAYDSDTELESNNQSQPPTLHKARSLTFSSSLTEGSHTEPKTVKAKEVSTNILVSSELHVDAPEFKPRPRASTTPLSSSLPSNVPNFGNTNKSYKRTREQHSGRNVRDVGKLVPRFFPAIVKDDLTSKVG